MPAWFGRQHKLKREIREFVAFTLTTKIFYPRLRMNRKPSVLFNYHKMYSFAAIIIMIIIRKIARIFLLSAASLLIMNSVLPHHHHHDEVCFISTHCSDNEADHHDTDAEHKGVDHDHHNDGTDFCRLNIFYLAPYGQNSSGKIKLSNIKKDQSSFTYSNSSQIALPFSSYNPIKIFIGDKKGLTAKFLTRALRAPPYC